MIKPKILIVEDEVLISLQLKKTLGLINYDILDPVTSGEEALISATSNRPDLVIMDIRLAGLMDGIETAKQIIENVSCQIIFLTGYPDVKIKDRAMKLNPAAYLSKPLNSARLESLLSDILSKKEIVN